uniref:UPAR/Ly6 domain-containing protein n=1 Tax=Panagrellus redivivus TaxID=6233 RepID=A0A7E4W1U6_PANRE
MSPNFLTLTIFAAVILMMTPSIIGLRCYQGQSVANANLSQLAAPTDCQMANYMNATGCVKQVNWQYNTATRACDYTSCSGAYPAGQCVNTTGTPGTTTCCCIGDTCNSAYSTSIGVFGVVSIIVGSLFAF